jgi:NAD(P)-dependent dehydrogenase (short-subunit alcohol dehydrogenase family)
MASVLGIKGGPGAPAYSAAKGAIIALTRSVAQEVIGSNIIVNAVAPGWVDTPLLDTMLPECKAFICAQTPAGRMGTVEEIVSTVMYLASDDANFFVGQVLSPNGGIVIG